MINSDIALVAVPDLLREAIGEARPGTRLYEQHGDSSDFHWWLDAVMEVCGQDGAYISGHCGEVLLGKQSRGTQAAQGRQDDGVSFL